MLTASAIPSNIVGKSLSLSKLWTDNNMFYNSCLLHFSTFSQSPLWYIQIKFAVFLLKMPGNPEVGLQNLFVGVNREQAKMGLQKG